MRRIFHLAPFALLATLSVAVIGCSPKTADDTTIENGRPPVSIDELEHDHEEHAHAETYTEAVDELEGMKTEISAAFAAEDIEAADGPIHEVGHVLEQVVDLAKQESFSDEATAEINAAVETLFDAFGRVDEKIHGGEGASYDEVKDEIDTAMATLRKHVPAGQPAGE